jgi:hypothetical protein
MFKKRDKGCDISSTTRVDGLDTLLILVLGGSEVDRYSTLRETIAIIAACLTYTMVNTAGKPWAKMHWIGRLAAHAVRKVICCGCNQDANEQSTSNISQPLLATNGDDEALSPITATEAQPSPLPPQPGA